MSNITSFPQRGDACLGVIERINEAYEMAKAGNIANVMIVMVDTDNNVYHGWANGNRPTLILGEMQCASHEFMIAETARRGVK